MSEHSLRTVTVFDGPDVQPAVHAARAGVAVLALQVRAAVHEADLAERSRDVRWESAREVLRMSLDELLDERRSALDHALAEARAEAATTVAAAHAEADRIVVEARRRQVEIRQRLDPDEPRPGGGPPAEPTAVTPPRSAYAEPPVDEPEKAVVEPAESEAVAGTETHEPDPEPAWGEEPPDSATHPSSADAAGSLGPQPQALLLTAEGVAQLLQAAVAAGVSQAFLATGGAPTPTPLPAPPLAVPSATPVVVRRPLWRRLLYVDVVLPLIAVLVVVVVLLAWVG